MPADPAPAPPVRLLRADEVIEGARLVSHTMLGGVDNANVEPWAEVFEPERTHGAYATDGSLVGIARWFAAHLSVPDGVVPAACVSAVAVLPTHRRQGHLTRLMAAELAAISGEGVPVALLVAAEWPIYGRFGYGPAVDACRWDVDATTARFVAPRTGRVELLEPPALQPHLKSVHDQRWARTPGAVTRSDLTFERIAGVSQWPDDKTDPSRHRGAIWRDHDGAVQGAVAYVVHGDWSRNRPNGRAEVRLLVGATVEAERELWRHLCELDWISSVTAGDRSVDDPLPLFLTDGRAAAQVDRFDCIWARILDVPAALGARRSTSAGTVVLDVVDDLGHASGRWSLDLGPDGAEVAATTTSPDVRLPVAALGAAYLGGTPVVRLFEAGWLDEEVPGGVARLNQLLATPTAPWSPTTY